MSPTKHRATRASGQPGIPSLQKRQQVLAGCLEACEGLGFHAEEQPSQAASFPLEACEYVEASHRLLFLQTEVAARENADQFGSLLDMAKLAENSRDLKDAQASLEFIMKNKDRLVAFLEQPFTGQCLTIEDGHQGDMLRLLAFATRDAELLCRGVEDFAWVMDFKEISSTWMKLLQPTPQAAAVTLQCHEGLASVQEAVRKLASQPIPV